MKNINAFSFVFFHTVCVLFAQTGDQVPEFEGDRCVFINKTGSEIKILNKSYNDKEITPPFDKRMCKKTRKEFHCVQRKDRDALKNQSYRKYKFWMC